MVIILKYLKLLIAVVIVYLVPYYFAIYIARALKGAEPFASIYLVTTLQATLIFIALLFKFGKSANKQD